MEEIYNSDLMKEMIGEVNNKLKEKRISRDEAREQKKDIRRVKELLRQKKANEEKEETLGDRSNYSRTENPFPFHSENPCSII